MTVRGGTESKILRIARALVKGGVSVLPIRGDGSKRPAVSWKRYQERLPTDEELRAWFGGSPTTGIAVVGGAVSGGLEILDFDEKNAWQENQLLERWQQQLGERLRDVTDSLPTIRTPTGGYHVYIRSGAHAGNTKLARSAAGEVLIETRGEGGYALAPGCPEGTHPAGGLYTLMRGNPASIPVLSAEDRDGLLAAARALDEGPPERVTALPAPPAVSLPLDGSLRPGDDYDLRGDLHALMDNHGWTVVRVRSDGTTEWLRPWKDPAGGKGSISATTGYDGERMLYVFSTNAAPFEPERKYSPFSVYTLLEHGGDVVAAARALGKLGFGRQADRRESNGRAIAEKPPRPAAEAPAAVEAVAAPKQIPPAPAEDPTPAAPAGGADELDLAHRWAGINAGKWGYFEGGQWWQYEAGRWLHSAADIAEISLQKMLEEMRATQTVLITARRVSNALRLARGHVGPHSMAELNAHPGWIGLKNGVFDTETGELRPHKPEHYLTTQLPFDYDPAASCPRWERFLSEVMLTSEGSTCDEWVGAIQEWMGYCMVPDTRAQTSMWWIGEGANGKGVAARVLEQLVGEEQHTAVPIEQLHDPYHRAALFGRLVGFVHEPDPRAMAKNSEAFKAIVGGDQISGRNPTEQPFTFKPTLRLVISCNALPRTRDQSHGYFRRIVIVEWRYNVPDDKRDRMLDETLRSELPGIFNWAVKGLQRFRERGYRFAELSESQALLGDYRLEQDSVGRFLGEECVFVATARTAARGLYGSYKAWCEAFGMRPENDQRFARVLKDKGCTRDLRYDADGRRERCWNGVGMAA